MRAANKANSPRSTATLNDRRRPRASQAGRFPSPNFFSADMVSVKATVERRSITRISTIDTYGLDAAR